MTPSELSASKRDLGRSRGPLDRRSRDQPSDQVPPPTGRSERRLGSDPTPSGRAAPPLGSASFSPGLQLRELPDALSPTEAGSAGLSAGSRDALPASPDLQSFEVRPERRSSNARPRFLPDDHEWPQLRAWVDRPRASANASDGAAPANGNDGATSASREVSCLLRDLATDPRLPARRELFEAPGNPTCPQANWPSPRDTSTPVSERFNVPSGPRLLHSSFRRGWIRVAVVLGSLVREPFPRLTGLRIRIATPDCERFSASPLPERCGRRGRSLPHATQVE